MQLNDYSVLEKRISAWALAENNVRALLVVGSRARDQLFPATQDSDLDLILFVSNPGPLVEDSAWLEGFSATWLKVLDNTGAGNPEWMVVYDGGFKVDFLVAQSDGPLIPLLTGSRLGEACRRGVRVVLDKAGELAPGTRLSWEAQPVTVPGEEEFAGLYGRFWLAAFRTASFLGRRDLWRALAHLNGPMQRDLLSMLAWHAQAHASHVLDTWYAGRFVEQWADSRTLVELPALFPVYDDDAIGRSLLAMTELFGRLAGETAGKWQLSYPAEIEGHIRDWIASRLPSGRAE
jgi:aminoglycoside 6-adenylyltransferase